MPRNLVHCLALAALLLLLAPSPPARAALKRLTDIAAEVAVKQTTLNTTARAVWTLRGLIHQLDDDGRLQPCKTIVASIGTRELSPADLAALANCYSAFRARGHSLARLASEFHRLAAQVDHTVIPDPAAIDATIDTYTAALLRAERALRDTGASRRIISNTCRPAGAATTLLARLQAKIVDALAIHDLLGAHRAFNLARAELQVSLSEELLCGAEPGVADAEMTALDTMVDQLSAYSLSSEYRYFCLSDRAKLGRLDPFCYRFNGSPTAIYALFRSANALALLRRAMSLVSSEGVAAEDAGGGGPQIIFSEGSFIKARPDPEPDPVLPAAHGWDCPFGGCGGTAQDDPGQANRSAPPPTTAGVGSGVPLIPDLPAGFGPASPAALSGTDAIPIRPEINPNVIGEQVASSSAFRTRFPDAVLITTAKNAAPGLWSWTVLPPTIALPQPPKLEDYRLAVHLALDRAYAAAERYGSHWERSPNEESSILVHDVDYFAAADFEAGLALITVRLQGMIQTAYEDGIAVLRTPSFALASGADATARAASTIHAGHATTVDAADVVRRVVEPSLEPGALYVARTLADLKDFVSQTPVSHPVFRNVADRDLWNRIVFIPPAFPQSAFIRELARCLAFRQTAYFDPHDSVLTAQARKDALTLLGVLSSFTPGVSTARSVYEAYTGQDLLTGEPLGPAERAFAIADAIFSIGGHVPAQVADKMLHLYGAVLTPLTKSQAEFASFVVDQLKTATDVHGAAATLTTAASDLLVDRIAEEPYTTGLGQLSLFDAAAVGDAWVGPGAVNTFAGDIEHMRFISTDRLRSYWIDNSAQPQVLRLQGRARADIPFRNEDIVRITPQ